MGVKMKQATEMWGRKLFLKLNEAIPHWQKPPTGLSFKAESLM